MKFEIKNKYLIFPVNSLATSKELFFKKNDETLYHLYVKIDNINPTFYAYIDVSRFLGECLDISVDPEIELVISQSDEMNIKNIYNEPMRPQIHFSTKNGWINDPNGLIYLDGVYHMFYQHNPADSNWGNMHWGHAESFDLIHWEEKDIALFPDERGAMYSGCAVFDNNNLIGKNIGEDNVALLFYTTTNPFCQHVSYSTDHFKTIKRLCKDPVIPHIIEFNRDPKVVYCNELGCYIMILYLRKDEYCIFKSSDLIDWIQLQTLQLKGDCECPDIFPLYDDQGVRKWVVMGAHDKYIVGNFDEGKFIAEQEEQSLHYGGSAYAGQSFNNLPNGRIVRMVWDRWGLPAVNFKGQMGIPMEMSIGKSGDIYYLEANPIQEIEKLIKTKEVFHNLEINDEKYFSTAIKQGPQLIKIKSKMYDYGRLSIKIFGRSIDVDYNKNEIKLGNYIAPISLNKNDFNITIVVDICSMELFIDGGKIFLSCLDNNTLADFNIPHLSISSNSEISLDSLEINSLNSIWNR